MQQSALWKVTAVFGQGWQSKTETVHVVADDENEAIESGVVALSQQIPEAEWQPPRVSAECVLSPVFVDA